ncbi:YceI family protein [Comamonas guangdongensis]|uniref:YceI family protein n=1 Tax=Comamonas guangdongensis TaxID=510515 RepID=A0ABV3ZWM9_9BURK
MKFRAQLVLALTALLAACAQPEHGPQPVTASTSAPAEFPAAAYAQVAAQRQKVLRVDPALSQIAITVRSGGPLARLGHDHVVSSRELQGYVAPEQGRADLYLALDSLSVDEPALRAEAGFDTQPSAADIAGTRANMLTKVLQTRQFPFVLIHVRAAPAAAGAVPLAVDITLHGVTRSFSVPADIERDGHGLRVHGRLAFDQSVFGIAPFSILGGAIQVQDRVELRFDVRASERPAVP